MAFLGPLCAHDLRQKRPTARAWIVVDHLTGVNLRYNRVNEFRPIASTTKLLTAYLVLRQGHLDDWVMISQKAAGEPPSKVNLRSGEFWRRRDLLYALLMQSANDAATALSESVAGNETLFCRQLTHLARSFGCPKTRIKKASGLPALSQGSTAQELARICFQVTKNEQIRSILRCQTRDIISRQGRRIHLRNKNKLSRSSQGVVLGKTGYTRKAKRCFAGVMRVAGRDHTVVLLGSKDLWGDLALLRNWTREFSRALIENRKKLSSKDVMHWQGKLENAGCRPGKIDGLWGARTQKAFLKWQQKKGFFPTGLVTPLKRELVCK
jgi:D-alanyl-D-alanine carboxypeptidase (penicillin-binding protein 5/6)